MPRHILAVACGASRNRCGVAAYRDSLFAVRQQRDLLPTSVFDWVAGLNWIDALLGAFVGGLLTTLRVGWRTLLNRRPLQRFFGDLVDDKKTLSVFAREMQSADGRYVSQLPDGSDKWWAGFPVVGLIDVEAATDALNVLGQAGRTANIAWRRVTTDSAIWHEPMICIGGNFKVDQILELCRPQFLTYKAPDTYSIIDGPTFVADSKHDYGLVARVRHPETGVSCVVLAGFGMAGTTAAGSFLRRRAAELANLYGHHSFAMVLRVGWHDGPAAAVPVWMSRRTMTAVQFLHPLIWRKYRAAIGGVVV